MNCSSRWYYLTLEAKTRSDMWLYYSHIGVAALFLAAYVAHRPVVRGSGIVIWRGIGGAVAVIFAGLVAFEIAFVPP